MADAFVQVATDGSGKKVQAFENTIGGNVVEAQAVSLVDTAGVSVGSIVSPLQVNDSDAFGSGTITATDAVVAAPAGDGTFRSGSSTAASYVALKCPGGDSAWTVGITGLTSGTLYFEGSPDSTNGLDGNWINVNGRRTGIVNTQLAGSATANGMYRGNTAGLTYYRVRSVGALSGTPLVKILIGSGPGAVFLNASIPPGTNAIGSVTGVGDVASGSADSGAPLKIGGQARTTNPTAVTDGQRVNAIFDKVGKQIVAGAVRDLKARQRTNIAASTSETTIVTAGGAGVFNDLYGLVITNNGAAVMAVTIRDVAAGTPVAVFEVPATDTRGMMLPVDSAIPQATANSAWTAACTPNATSVDITALFVKNI